MPEAATQFATRFGRCIVDERGITLVNDAPRGRLSALISGRSIWTLRALYALVHVVSMGALATTLWSGGSVDFLLPFMIFYSAFALWRTMDHTREMAIGRDEVHHVLAVPGIRFLTVPRLLVHYDREGVRYKRMIQLHGSLFAKPEGFDAAKQVIRQGGFDIA